MVVWQSGSLAVSLARDEVFGHESAVDVVEETAVVWGVRVAVGPREANTVELGEECESTAKWDGHLRFG